MRQLNLNLLLGMILGAVLILVGQNIRQPVPDAVTKTDGAESNQPKHAQAVMGLETIADLAEKGGKSTVNIDTTATISRPSSLMDVLLGAEPIIAKGMGSGFIIREDGYILTNSHVIESADDIRVTLPSEQKSISASLVGRDPDTDLALLKVDRKGLNVASLGNSKKIRPGDWVVAIGSPLGLQQSVTLGIVSALNRTFSDFGPTQLIQTDAAINPGNSGGPLLNISGEVIGVNVMIRRDAQNIGFAIPVETAREVADQLLRSGKVFHPRSLGIAFSDFLVDTGRETSTVVVVMEVQHQGIAAKSGIRRGDIIISMNNEKVSSSDNLRTRLNAIKPDQKLEMDLFRDGRLLHARLN